MPTLRPQQDVVKYSDSTNGNDTFTGDNRVNVPPGSGPYATIQHGVDELAHLNAPDKKLIVLTGEYKENVEMAGAAYSDITVTGELSSGSELPDPGDFCDIRPLVDGQRLGPVFDISDATGVTLSNLSIQRGKSKKGGGIKAARCEIDIVDCCIQNNQADEAGGGFHLSECHGSRVLNCRILTNLANSVDMSPKQGGGGGGRVTKSRNVAVSQSIFTGNMAPHSLGGGLCIDNKSKSISILACDFGGYGTYPPEWNLGRYGGGIGIGECRSITVMDNNVVANQAAVEGGGLCITECRDVLLMENDIESNLAGETGGGVRLSVTESVDLVGNAIEDNHAQTGSGGGIAAGGIGIDLESNDVIGNTAFTNGGGVFAYVFGFSSRSDRVANNSADGSGGGMFLDCEATDFHNTRITNNTALQHGGGVCSITTRIDALGNFEMETCTVRYNKAGGDGGGLYSDWRCVLKNCVFAKNTSKSSGGGLNVSDGGLKAENCNFLSNKAALDGGGIWAKGDVVFPVSISNSQITRNKAGINGGGLLFERDNLTLTKTAFDGNAANTGGGVRLSQVSVAGITQNRFEANQAANGSGVTADTCTFGPAALNFQQNAFSGEAGPDVLLVNCQPNTLTAAGIAGDNSPGGAAPPDVVIK